MPHDPLDPAQLAKLPTTALDAVVGGGPLGWLLRGGLRVVKWANRGITWGTTAIDGYEGYNEARKDGAGVGGSVASGAGNLLASGMYNRARGK